jgi:inosine/guanosine/xanthosine phosphorylase family protein
VADYVRARSRVTPRLGIVLGSGFADAAAALTVEARFRFEELPGFPPPTVAGHAGELRLGALGAAPVALFCGRLHHYEGHPMAVVTLPLRVLAALGAGAVLLTNAAGAVNPALRPGDFVAVTDHLNFMGANPLRGDRDGMGRFVDLTGAYDAGLRARLRAAAEAAGITLGEGVYAAVSGPSFETPAEIRAFRTLGADLVGMSTVPEVIAARRLGVRVAAVSCVTNLAAGLTGAVSHEEVLEVGRAAGPRAAALLREFAERHVREADQSAGR